MKNEQSVFKLFLRIELAKQLNNNKELGSYRYVIDIQDQSKTFNSTSTQSILFFLNEIENNTNLTVKIISEQTNKILGTLIILVPFAINYEQEQTVTELFQFENEITLDGSYTLYLINTHLFKQQNSNDTSIQKNSTIIQTQGLQKQISKSPQSKFSQLSYSEKINKKVSTIINNHHHSQSSRKDRTIDTEIINESPSRISDRVQVSRSGTIVQSEVNPSQVRKYVMEDSPSKLTCSFNKDKEINHRHQDLSCQYYLDQATQSNQIRIENENLKEIIINLNTKLEYQEQQIILFTNLEQNYNDIQNQLATYLKSQELNKSFESVFEKEISKVNAQLNQRICQFLENEKQFSKQKLDFEIQIFEQKNEIKMLRQNLYELSEKQQYYTNLNNDLSNLKQLNMDLKQEIIKNVKDYESKLTKFDQHLIDQNKKIEDQTKLIKEQKQQYLDIERQNKALSFELKKFQDNNNSQKKPIINLMPSSNNSEKEEAQQQLQITQEISKQKQIEIEKLQNALKKAQQVNLDQSNQQVQTKQALIQAKQELSKLKEQNLQNQNQKTKQQTEIKQFQQQIETEKSKIITLQSQLKAKSIQLQEAQVREDSLQNKILKLEQIIKQSKNLMQNQEEQINLLNNQIKDLLDAKQKQQSDIKEDKEKMNQIKQLISGMKEQRVVYIPMHGDPIDHALSEYINSVDDPKKLIELFFREKEGQYSMGSKSIHLKTEQGKVFVKIGGGFIGIEEFLDIHQRKKVKKQKKKNKVQQLPKLKCQIKVKDFRYLLISLLLEFYDNFISNIKKLLNRIYINYKQQIKKGRQLFVLIIGCSQII